MVNEMPKAITLDTYLQRRRSEFAASICHAHHMPDANPQIDDKLLNVLVKCWTKDYYEVHLKMKALSDKAQAARA